MPLTAKQRQTIVEFALWGVRSEPQIHYGEIRPIPHPPVWPRLEALPFTTDCSGFATMCYQAAGAGDPNGLGYDGQGFTGTLLSHMRRIPWWRRKPGDLVVYGPGSGHHVCVFIEAKGVGDALLVSHGREQAPELVLQSVMKRGQPSPVTWLTLP